jgi:hypothetical protein
VGSPSLFVALGPSSTLTDKEKSRDMVTRLDLLLNLAHRLNLAHASFSSLLSLDEGIVAAIGLLYCVDQSGALGPSEA